MVDLNLVNIEDILCTNEAIRRLTNLGREEMPDAAGIWDFNYDPQVEDAAEDAEARRVSSEDAEATPTTQEPPVDP
jgi:hypothetical protein